MITGGLTFIEGQPTSIWKSDHEIELLGHHCVLEEDGKISISNGKCKPKSTLLFSIDELDEFLEELLEGYLDKSNAYKQIKIVNSLETSCQLIFSDYVRWSYKRDQMFAHSSVIISHKGLHFALKAIRLVAYSWINLPVAFYTINDMQYDKYFDCL